MAFATTNNAIDYIGSLKILYGQWSGAAGDSNGSIAVNGGMVYAALFTSQDTSGGQIMYPVKVSASTSSATTTVTVYNTADVTNGRFMIWYR